MASAYLTEIIDNIVSAVVSPLVLLLTAAALVYFLYGVAVFIKNVDDEVERSKGKQHMIYGIIGLFIMLGAYGLIGILAGTFDVDTSPLPAL